MLETKTIPCPAGHAERIVKYDRGKRPQRKQRYLCNECGRIFYAQKEPRDIIDTRFKRRAIVLYVQGCPLMEITRYAGASHTAVSNWVEKSGIKNYVRSIRGDGLEKGTKKYGVEAFIKNYDKESLTVKSEFNNILQIEWSNAKDHAVYYKDPAVAADPIESDTIPKHIKRMAVILYLCGCAEYEITDILNDPLSKTISWMNGTGLKAALDKFAGGEFFLTLKSTFVNNVKTKAGTQWLTFGWNDKIGGAIITKRNKPWENASLLDDKKYKITVGRKKMLKEFLQAINSKQKDEPEFKNYVEGKLSKAQLKTYLRKSAYRRAEQRLEKSAAGRSALMKARKMIHSTEKGHTNYINKFSKKEERVLFDNIEIPNELALLKLPHFH